MSGAGSHPHEPTRLENFAAASLRKPFTSEALLTCVEQHLPARPRPTRSAAP